MSNRAAWYTGPKARPFKVDDAPMPTPEPNEIVIRNYAVALNPVDAVIQAQGIIVEKFPFIIGCDAAGEVVAVGADVKTFKKGDRVTVMTDGMDNLPPSPRNNGKSTNTSFQLYCATADTFAAHIPSGVSYTEACVLPLAMCTAATGLFNTENLALPHPKAIPQPTGKVLLVWGGSSSVGSCAIQLARAAGLTVATTASSRNQEYCRKLGAQHVFDHTKESVVDEIVNELSGCDFAGVFDAIIATDTLVKSGQIASRLAGRKFVATVLPPAWPLPEGLPDSVEYGMNWGTSICRNEVGPSVFGWIPEALANGTLKCKPDPFVVGQGLERLQEACDLQLQGNSARKLVVELP